MARHASTPWAWGLEDDERDEVQFLLLPQASDAHSLGLWTAIRNYMEDGQLVDKQDPLSALLNQVLQWC